GHFFGLVEGGPLRSAVGKRGPGAGKLRLSDVANCDDAVVVDFARAAIVVAEAGVAESFDPVMREKFEVETDSLLEGQIVDHVPAIVGYKAPIGGSVVAGLSAVGMKEDVDRTPGVVEVVLRPGSEAGGEA